MKREIKNRFTGSVLFSAETETLKLCVERAVKSGADLSRADLFGSSLSGADLLGADLSRAYLSGADLSRSDLSRAYLSGAYLSGADLSGAYLSRAYLSGANLSGADLFTWAQVGWHSHGERGRTLTAIKQTEESDAMFFCGCFKGAEKELREYISNGEEAHKASRTLCLETVIMLLKQAKRKE